MALYLLHGKNPCKIARYLDLMSNFAEERIHIKCLEFVRMILKYVKAGGIFHSKIWVPFQQNFSRKYLPQDKVPMTSAMQMPLSPCRQSLSLPCNGRFCSWPELPNNTAGFILLFIHIYTVQACTHSTNNYRACGLVWYDRWKATQYFRKWTKCS